MSMAFFKSKSTVIVMEPLPELRSEEDRKAGLSNKRIVCRAADDSILLRESELHGVSLIQAAAAAETSPTSSIMRNYFSLRLWRERANAHPQATILLFIILFNIEIVTTWFRLSKAEVRFLSDFDNLNEGPATGFDCTPHEIWSEGF